MRISARSPCRSRHVRPVGINRLDHAPQLAAGLSSCGHEGRGCRPDPRAASGHFRGGPRPAVSKDAVEKDMAINAATRLSEWAKLFAIALGVPAAIAVGILAFVDIHYRMNLYLPVASMHCRHVTDLSAQDSSVQRREASL